MSHLFQLGFYRYLLSPFAIAVLKVTRPWLSSKLQETVNERKKSKLPELTNKHEAAPFWIHCSSGEYEYAKPLIRRLKEIWPEVPILVTYMSPSVKASLAKGKDIDLWLPSPWDRPKDLQNFLSTYKPRALLIARTDAWPEMLYQAKAFGVPSLLFSATLADNSSRLRWPGRIWSAVAFEALTEIYCVASEDQSNFKRLVSGDKISVCGDTRFDQVQFRLKNPQKLKDELTPPKDEGPIIVLGSTWDEDEEVWLEALASLKNQYPNLRLMIAPHEPHPNHLSRLRDKLMSTLGLPSQLYSEASTWNKGEVLLIDQVGILADLYKWGHIAFVGGSFKYQVHSVMEPLAQGLVCLVGPKHLNNREALQFKKVHLPNRSHGAVIEVKNAQEIIAAFKSLEDSWASPELAKSIQTQVRSKMGATEAVIDWLRKRQTKPLSGPVL